MPTYVSDYRALISGYSWNDFTGKAQVQGKPAFVSFSFEAVAPAGDTSLTAAEKSSFRALTPSEQTIVRQAMSAWADASGLTTFEVPSGGSIEFRAYTFDPSGPFGKSAGYSFYPNPGGVRTFFESSYGVNPVLAQHEIGHALGIKHPWEGDFQFDPAAGRQSIMQGGGSDNRLTQIDREAIANIYGAQALDGTQVSSWSWEPQTYTLTQSDLRSGAILLGVGGANNHMTAGDGATLTLTSGRGTVTGGTGVTANLGDGVYTVRLGDNAKVNGYSASAANVTTGANSTIIVAGGKVVAGDGATVSVTAPTTSSIPALMDISVGSGGSVYGGTTLNPIIAHGGRSTNLTGGKGDDVLFSTGTGGYTLQGNGGVDVAVVAASRPAANFGTQDRGAAGTNYYVQVTVGGVASFQQYVGLTYIEFTDALFSTAKARYVASIDFTALRSSYSAVLRTAESAASHLAVAKLADQIDSGALTLTSASQQVVASAASTSSVATLAYQFFTGAAPSAAGMDYLVSPTGPNANNLNSAYYASFNTTNRYINFASNLGKVGEGAAAFSASYGGLNLTDATAKAYAAIFGSAPSAAKVDALLHDRVPNGAGGTYERQDYFAAFGLDGLNGQGTKAAMVGWLLGEAVKADVGTYARANDAFLLDVALHDAPFGVDLVGKYAKPEFVIGG